MQEKLTTLEEFIEYCYKQSNYKEIIRIISICPINFLSRESIRYGAISYFKCKRYDKTIELIEYFLSKLVYDFFLYEIYAESLFKKNRLTESLEAFLKALYLNPKLKSAKYKYIVLKYRLKQDIDNSELDFLLDYALSRKSVPILRTASYISLAINKNAEALLLMNEIMKLDDSNFTFDYLTLSEIYKRMNNLELSEQYKMKAKETSFKSEFISNGENKLFITLSPINKFILKKYPIKADKLHIFDNSFSYYTYSIDQITEEISHLLEKHKYDQILIVGSSKAATGVLYLMDNLIKSIPQCVSLKGVACSPQIQIMPFNPNLEIPSYQTLQEYIDCNPVIKKLFDKHSELPSLDIRNNDKLTIFYGKNFNIDSNEIQLLNNKKLHKNIEIIPLNYSGHGSILPLTIPENKTLEDLKKSYAKLSHDSDFLALGGGKTLDIIDEIWNIYSDPEMRLYKFL